MSSKKRRLKAKHKAIPTLDLLRFKPFNMIDGQFKGLSIYLVNRNPHGRWSMHTSTPYVMWSYIDEDEFFRCVECTPEIKQFKREKQLNKLIGL